MSDGTYPFVEKVMDYAKQDSQFLPPFVKPEELEKDWSVVTNLLPALRKIQQLESNLDDTVMVAGSEAYLGALSYYNSVKYGSKMNIADAKVIFEDLRQRFNRTSTTNPPEEVEA